MDREQHTQSDRMDRDTENAYEAYIVHPVGFSHGRPHRGNKTSCRSSQIHQSDTPVRPKSNPHRVELLKLEQSDPMARERERPGEREKERFVRTATLWLIAWLRT